MQPDKLEKTVSYARFISIIAVIASGFGSLLMYLIGAVKVVRAYTSFFIGDEVSGTAPLVGANVSIAYLIQAIDAFLIAVVLMIFGGGIYNLFVRPMTEDQSAVHLFTNIQSISELKSIIAELVIIILMVTSRLLPLYVILPFPFISSPWLLH